MQEILDENEESMSDEELDSPLRKMQHKMRKLCQEAKEEDKEILREQARDNGFFLPHEMDFEEKKVVIFG